MGFLYIIEVMIILENHRVKGVEVSFIRNKKENMVLILWHHGLKINPKKLLGIKMAFEKGSWFQGERACQFTSHSPNIPRKSNKGKCTHKKN